MREDVKEALKKLIADETVLQGIISVVDGANEEIEKRGLVTREIESQSAPTPPKEESSTEETVSQAEEIELDDSLIERVVQKLAGTPDIVSFMSKANESINSVASNLEVLSQSVGSIQKDLAEFKASFTVERKKFVDRLDLIEKTDQEKLAILSDDKPRKQSQTIIYRAKSQDSKDEKKSSDEIARETLANIK